MLTWNLLYISLLAMSIHRAASVAVGSCFVRVLIRVINSIVLIHILLLLFKILTSEFENFICYV